jgi:hypothetical protein
MDPSYISFPAKSGYYKVNRARLYYELRTAFDRPL